jgi:hypothetical protein
MSEAEQAYETLYVSYFKKEITPESQLLQYFDGCP